MKNTILVILILCFNLQAAENNSAPKKKEKSPTYTINRAECKKVNGNWTTDYNTMTDVCKDRKTRKIITILEKDIKKSNSNM